MNARKFMFGEDLRGPVRDEAGERQALEAAARDAYARGLAQGRRQAEEEQQAQLAAAISKLARDATALLGDATKSANDTEAEALAFFTALARKLAGQALADDRLASIREAATEVFRHLRGVPHLAVRVSPTLVDAVDPVLKAMARDAGYEGRIIIIGQDDMDEGAARLEWADGGIVRDRARLEGAVDAILATAFH
jgi:flagellar assembly protein FliH